MLSLERYLATLSTTLIDSNPLTSEERVIANRYVIAKGDESY